MAKSDNPTKLVDLKTGYGCNNNCFFCAQASNRYHGDKDSATLKKEIKESRSQGCNKIVFTGGEVTIRPDIAELISYSSRIGFKDIQIQTNGRALYYKKLCKELVNAGANEFAVAIHGHIPQLHDYLTRSPGSFAQTTQGIRNLRELDQMVLTNTVIVKPNYRYAEQIARMLIGLDVDQYQLAFVHPCSNAAKYFDKMVPFVSIAAPFIHKGLQVGIDAGIKVMAEAMPFCVMKGYEKYVSEFHIPPAQVREYDFVVKDFETTRKTELKVKFPQCKSCRYELICEGPWKEYPEKRGNQEFRPVPGKKLTSQKQVQKE